MGMYTEVLVKVTLKAGCKQEVYDVIDYMFGDGELPSKLPEHGFFTKQRWDSIGKCNSSYHHPEVVNIIYKCDKCDEKDWCVFSRSDLKNYDGEVEAFFNWVQTIADGPAGLCIGYYWYEEDKVPTLVRKE